MTPHWRKLWISSVVLAGLFGFGYGWDRAVWSPPSVTKTKVIEPPEVKLLRKGRYDEAAKAILDSIKDEKKDSWRYQSVAAVYYARAQHESQNREKWLGEAESYIEKSIRAVSTNILHFSRELSFSPVRMALILGLALTLQRLRSFT